MQNGSGSFFFEKEKLVQLRGHECAQLGDPVATRGHECVPRGNHVAGIQAGAAAAEAENHSQKIPNKFYFRMDLYD